MPQVVNYSTRAVTIKSKIYVLCATTKGTIMQIYDTATNEWTVKTDVPFINYMEIVNVGNNIYVYNADNNENPILIYNVESERWTSSNSGPSLPRNYPAICAVGTNIYLLGGSNIPNSRQFYNSLEIYDTTTESWRTVSPMPTPRALLKTVVIGDKIYAIGGSSSNTVEIYDTKTDKWTSTVSLKSQRSMFGSAVVGEKIYVIGGSNGSSGINTVESLEVGVTVLNLSVLLNEGETVQLSTSYNLDNNKKHTWSSTNESVATVDTNGKVTAVGEGDADIYAESADGTFKEYIPVKVVEGIADELRLAVHLKAGEKAKLYLTDDPSQVTWNSMDDSTVTVSANGQITGVKKGLAIVQAELDGETYQIYVRVNG